MGTEEPFIFMEMMKTDWKAARVLLEELKAGHVVQANKRRIPHTMKVGDLVLVDVQKGERLLLDSMARGRLGVRHLVSDRAATNRGFVLVGSAGQCWTDA